VKTCFLCGFARPAFGFAPVQSAKKGPLRSPFFGVKATKPATHPHGRKGARSAPLREPQGRAGFALGFDGLKAKLALPSNPNQTVKKQGFAF
jgi:hypothetical protein